MNRSRFSAGAWGGVVLSVCVVCLLLAGLLVSGCRNPFLGAKPDGVEPPTFSPAGGVFGTDQLVTLASSTGGAVIHYTTDGSPPTEASALYSKPLAIAGQGTTKAIKAFATKSGLSPSAVVSTSFVIDYSIGGAGTLDSPSFSPTSGVYPSSPTVKLSGPSGAKIFYTTDGSEPSTANGKRYAAPFTLSGSNGSTVTVRAVSTKPGVISSPIVSATYEINFSQVGTPQFAPVGGIFTADQTAITITVPSAPAGTNIYFTFSSNSTTGTPPATAAGGSTFQYSAGGRVVTPVPPVAGDASVVTLQAIATSAGFTNSTVASATYTIGYPQAASPSFSLVGGVYATDLDGARGHSAPVALSCATSGAAIYYTADGSPPTYPASGTTALYSVPITIAGDGTVTTLNAISVKSGMKPSAAASATYSVSYGTTTLAPQLDKPGGSYATDLSGANGVCIGCGTSGAVIYYTLDGSMPTTASSVFTPSASAPISIAGDGATKTITAMAKAPELKASPVTQGAYAIHYAIPAPVLSLAGGSYSSDLDGVGGRQGPVVISDVNANADIYYTTNGSAPTTASTKIPHGTTVSVTIAGDGKVETINALALDSMGVKPQSSVTTATYTIAYPQVATPSFAPAGGAYTADLDGTGGHPGPVALSCATSGASIYYTTDGSTPAYPITGTSALYSGAIAVAGDGTVATIRAIAAKTGMKTSGLASATYSISYGTTTLAPQLSRSGGYYPYDLSGANAVSLSDLSAGAIIYYTTDGSTPNPSSSPPPSVFMPGVTPPFTIAGDGAARVITAIAIAPGLKASPVTQATYVILYPVAAPTFSLAGGAYSTDLDGAGGRQGPVVIRDTNANADIYYTLDGTTPTTASTKINHGGTASVTIAGDGTIESINAFADDFTGARPNSSVTSATYTISYAAQVTSPSFAPAGGTYSANLDGVGADPAPVALSCATGGASIYYTLDGTTPTYPMSGSTALYAGAIAVAGNGTMETIHAIAAKAGLKTSSVASATYSIALQVATPSFAPAGGSYSADLTGGSAVTISDTTGGASIYYTTDGTTPTYPMSGTTSLYSGPIAISGDGTVKTIRAIAAAAGMTSSLIAGATYSIGYTTVSTPIIAPAAGSYSTDFSVTISDLTPGASIYYTSDGSTPTYPVTGSTTLYGAPISVAGDGTTCTVLALAVHAGMKNSSVTSAAYSIAYSTQVAAPTFTPAGGTFTADLTGGSAVTISDATGGASIYYTVDGTTPTYPMSGSTALYAGAISVTGNGTMETIHAIAAKAGLKTSSVASATYSIALQVATPTFSLAAGSYTADQSVSLSCTTGGSSIYYTLDGTTPTYPITGTTALYSGPIAVAGDGTVETIRAIAAAAGMTNSLIAGATYTIAYSTVTTPIIAPAAGSYGADQSVTISDLTGGASIYYTLDGTTPTFPMTGTTALYAGPISVAGDGTSRTVNAIAAKTGMKTSALAAATYSIHYSQVSAPTFNLASGIYGSDQTVTISDATGGATIYYTTDGSAPTTSSPAGPAAGVSVSVFGSNLGAVQTTIRAMAVHTAMTDSTQASASYTISYAADGVTPTIAITPTGPDTISADGTHITATSAPSITLSGGGASTVYYYTIALNGTPAAPTIGGTSVNGPVGTFPVASYGGGAASTVTVKAFALDPQTTAGSIVTTTFSVNSIASTPTLSLVAGTRYVTDQSLSISDLTPGGTIYAYVNPGTAAVTASPSTFTNTGASSVSTVITGPLNASTVTAMATAPGYVASSVTAAATYSIAYTKFVVASTTSFTVPPYVSTLTFKLWGAGGSGGYGASGPGGSGGGGGFAESVVPVSTGQVYVVTIGSPGFENNWTGYGGQMTSVTLSGTYVEIAGGGGGGGDGYFGNGGAGGGGGQNGGASSYGMGNGGYAGSAGIGGPGGNGDACSGFAGQDIGAGGGSGGAIFGVGGGGSGYGGGGGGGGAYDYAGGGGDSGGGGGGGNLGTITISGNYSTPGNAVDPDLLPGSGVGGPGGGGGGGPGAAGFAVIYVN